MNTKKYIRAGLAILLLMQVSTAVVAETRIAAVNINKLMEMAPQAKSASDNMKIRFADRERGLLAEQNKIRELEERFRKDKDFISASEKDSLEIEVRERLREFKRKSDNFTEDFSLARNEALNTLQTDVYKAIVLVAEKESYDLVVSESVLFASKRIDITDQVLEQLKVIHGQSK